MCLEHDCGHFNFLKLQDVFWGLDPTPYSSTNPDQDCLSQDWTTSKKKRDFSEDLQLFALQTGVRTIAGQPVGLRTAKNLPGAAEIKRQGCESIEI